MSLKLLLRSRIIMLSLLIPVFLKSQVISNNETFVPDKSIEKLAQNADKQFFPLFLKSFEWIRNNDTARISEYFNHDVFGKQGKKSGFQVDPGKLKITPVYRPGNYSGFDYPVKFPIAWSDTIQPDPSWRLWFHSLTWLDPYLKSSNDDSVAVAFCVINDWISAHLEYPVPNEIFAFDDHAVAARLVVFTDASAKLQELGSVDEHFQSKLLLSILNHIFFVCSLEKYTCWHNHAIIFDERLISALKKLKDFKLRDELLKLAFARVFEQYRYAFTSEGVHKEHSPCYHMGISSSLNSLVAVAVELNIPVPASLIQIQKKAKEYTRYIALNGTNLPIGDCSRYISTIKTKKADISLAGKDGPTVSPKRTGTNQHAGLFSFKCKLFPQSGWMYVYDTVRKINIVAQSDFFSWSHYQQDETSFIITAAGNEMIIDPGLYSYIQSPVYDYYHSSLAHNMLIADSLPGSADIKNTGLSGITRYYQEFDKYGSYSGAIEMTHSLYKQDGIEVYRQFFFPGGHEMVIRDVACSKDDHTYRQLFHLAPEAIITKTKDGFFIRWEEHSNYLVIRSKIDNFSIIKGQKHPLQGWYFPSFNQIEEAPVLILEKLGKSCEFTTRISIGISDSPEKTIKGINRKYKSLRSKLEKINRREMIHLPYPERWRPVRN